MRLNDKIAIVTGSTRGIGLAIAKQFLKEGARVVINGRKQKDCDKIAKELGKNAIAIGADVSKAKEVQNLIDETVKKFGKLDIIVNNAGIVHMKNFIELTEEEWDRMMEVDLKGVFLCSQKTAKQMIKQGNGGKIINISSIAGFVGFPRLAHYCAAKAGVIELTKEVAIELAPHKINVNCIGPGVIETDMTKGLLNDEKMKQGLLMKIPLNRIGKPEDIAHAAVYLASNESDYTTGITLFVDGGWLTE